MPFAAFKTDEEWLPLSSIRETEHGVLNWIIMTYQAARLSDWQVIPIEIRRVRKKRRKK